MSISEQLVRHIENLQAQADGAAAYTAYPENHCLLPNDAIYLTRRSNLAAVCGMIEKMVEESGKPLATVLSKAVKPSLSDISKSFPFTEDALEVLIRDFGENSEGVKSTGEQF